jgi:MFS family permease
VNLLDGGFFGFGIGFASFVTILPLFVSTLTDSAILIGLIPAIHAVGWQLPQLLTAHHVARQRRYKPMVVRMTIHERLPFFCLIFVALWLPRIGNQAALGLTFLLLVWQGLGAGFTAGAWQSMIAKIMPARMRGTFYGLQSSAANLLASGSAIIAGFLLAGSVPSILWPALAWPVYRRWSHLCLGDTHQSEPAAAGVDAVILEKPWTDAGMTRIRWFWLSDALSSSPPWLLLLHRLPSEFGVNEVTIGVMTSVHWGRRVASPLMAGWRSLGHRSMMEIGLLLRRCQLWPG